MKNKHLYQFFKVNSFVYCVKDYDIVISGIFRGFTNDNKAVVQVAIKKDGTALVDIFEPKALFASRRQAVVASRWKPNGINVYYFPAYSNTYEQQRAIEFKVLDYVSGNRFIRELDIVFEDSRISSFAAFLTEFEARHAMKNKVSPDSIMIHETAIMEHCMNNDDNQEVQSVYIFSKILKKDFSVILN